MSGNKERMPINLVLDKFQWMKYERMKYLLDELEEIREVRLSEYLSHLAIDYGIRKKTALEYIEAWKDGGCITVKGDKIKFLKKPEKWR